MLTFTQFNKNIYIKFLNKKTMKHNFTPQEPFVAARINDEISIYDSVDSFIVVDCESDRDCIAWARFAPLSLIAKKEKIDLKTAFNLIEGKRFFEDNNKMKAIDLYNRVKDFVNKKPEKYKIEEIKTYRLTINGNIFDYKTMEEAKKSIEFNKKLDKINEIMEKTGNKFSRKTVEAILKAEGVI